MVALSHQIPNHHAQQTSTAGGRVMTPITAGFVERAVNISMGVLGSKRQIVNLPVSYSFFLFPGMSDKHAIRWKMIQMAGTKAKVIRFSAQ